MGIFIKYFYSTLPCKKEIMVHNKLYKSLGKQGFFTEVKNGA